MGWRCSNPDCRKPTRAANDDPQQVTNIGVAAHICAAASGGPRYDSNMSSDERKSADNGIWLCQSCSKLIDDDVVRYNFGLLRILCILSHFCFFEMISEHACPIYCLHCLP